MNLQRLMQGKMVKPMIEKMVVKNAIEAYKQAKTDIDNDCYDVVEFEKRLKNIL